MHKVKLVAIGLLIVSSALGLKAQLIPPVSWQYRAEKITSNTYLVHIIAKLSEGWHIYSQQQPAGAIAKATSISFNNNPFIHLEGEILESGNLNRHLYKNLNITQNEYTGRVEFVQKVKLKAAIKTNLVAIIDFQVCTDKSCLPPEEKRILVNLN